MATIGLKSLHNYLRVLENASEMKRRMPASYSSRTLKEGLYEMSKLVGVDEAVFKEPQHVAALIGEQRFVMIRGEPSVTDHVARIFDNSRALVAALVDPEQLGTGMSNQAGFSGSTAPQQGGAMAASSAAGLWTSPQSPASPDESRPEEETRVESLSPLLSGNPTLSARLFRALFEHMLGVTPGSDAQQGNISLVHELTGSKEHGRSFLSTAMFILGAEVDRNNLITFMMQQDLLGIPVFEHILENRNYCDAFHSFRRLKRAFVGMPAAEEAQLSNRLDKFNAQFGGKPYGAKILEGGEMDKSRVDAYLAATDVLEALALTPWCLSLSNAIAISSSNSVRSVSVIAGYFRHFDRGEMTKERANREIADHLLAFATQFSADTKPA
jgi:hypothetical protein